MTDLVEPLHYCPFDFAQGRRGSDALKDWLDVSRLCSRPSADPYREESAERNFLFASELGQEEDGPLGPPPLADERTVSLRKEVIQPQVLLQLPCYDFTPITDHTLGAGLPCGLAQRLLVQPAFVM